MGERPGSVVARRPLHFFVVADCSGSMAADGKMQALNTAMRETLPHLVSVAGQNPHAELLLRVLAFSTGARWHVEKPTAVESFEWRDLEPGGYTDLGAALLELAAQLAVPPMEERALPPAIILVSDGMPTDDWRRGLGALLDQPWGGRAVRMAVGIGRDADREVLQRFIGRDDSAPLNASNPEQLVRLIRWASTHAGRVASTMSPDEAGSPGSALTDATSEIVW
jgi:uncharacterized protein YegL